MYTSAWYTEWMLTVLAKLEAVPTATVPVAALPPSQKGNSREINHC
jgi:hypothetical protein